MWHGAIGRGSGCGALLMLMGLFVAADYVVYEIGCNFQALWYAAAISGEPLILKLRKAFPANRNNNASSRLSHLTSRCRGRKNAFLDQRLAQANAVGIIDFKNVHRGAADGSTADLIWSVPGEVALPFVPARVEQRRYLLA